MARRSSNPDSELQAFELRRAGVRAQLHPRVGPELSSAWLLDPDALVARPGESLPDVFRGPSLDRAWFVKRRVGRAGRRALQRSFHTGLALEDAGLSVAVHLGVIQKKDPAGRRCTWLLTEFLEGADFDRALLASKRHERLALLETCAARVAELHAAGYRQRDLKAPNLRVTPEGSLALVDLEGVARGAGSRRREKDLGRLAASFLVLQEAGLEPDSWARFVAAYVAHGGARGDAAALEARTLLRAKAKVARNCGRRLPLR